MSLLYVFLFYVAMILGFAIAYFWIYLGDDESFQFAKDMDDARFVQKQKCLIQKISILEMQRDYLSTLQDCHPPFVEGDSWFSFASRYATTFMKDRRRIGITQEYTGHPDVGCGAATPVVHLIRQDGTTEWKGKCVGLSAIDSEDPFDDILKGVPDALRIIDNQLEKAYDRWNDFEIGKSTVWSFIDFLYFSTITQTTVGYGDILPNSTIVRSLVASQAILTQALVLVVLNIVVASVSQ